MFTLINALIALFSSTNVIENNVDTNSNSFGFTENQPTYIQPSLEDFDWLTSPNKINFESGINKFLELNKAIDEVKSTGIINSLEQQVKIKTELVQYANQLITEYSDYANHIIKFVNNIQQFSNIKEREIEAHQNRIRDLINKNYKLPKLNKIEDPIGKIVTTTQNENTFEDIITLHKDYYYENDLIIPKTKNPYTEIYKLPCNFEKVTPENKRILLKSEKKIALLTIESDSEFIDLSQSKIQYFIRTTEKCKNLKEIRYPPTKEN